MEKRSEFETEARGIAIVMGTVAAGIALVIGTSVMSCAHYDDQQARSCSEMCGAAGVLAYEQGSSNSARSCGCRTGGE